MIIRIPTLWKVLKFMLNSIWAIPAVLFIRIIRPWMCVCVGIVAHDRIGHFVADTCLYLAHISLRSKNDRTIYLFFIPRPTCNEQWERMVRRQLVARWWVRYLCFYNRLIPGKAVHQLPSFKDSQDIHGILHKSSARFEFTSEEDATAKAWLRRRGWQDGEPFICLLVRDSAYLSQHPFHKNKNFDYHNYRDSDINNYVESVQALVDKGYWVIRMGQIMHKRLPIQHKRVIDYPFVEDQDDLLDIWLSANCLFFISNGGGIDKIPYGYNIPMVNVNFMPLIWFSSEVNSVFVPKHLVWKDSRKLLTLRDYLLMWNKSSGPSGYDLKEIAIEDLSTSEITDAVLEMEQRIAGVWKDEIEGQVRQQRFWEVYRAGPDFNKWHDYKHPEARVGYAWLKSMGDAFLEEKI